MKFSRILSVAFLAVLLFASCDANKSKIEEMTTEFEQAVKNNDVATIYDMYPDAKLMENMKLPASIEQGDIEVIKNDVKQDYLVIIKNSRRQKLIFKLSDKGVFKIIDSYGLFEISKEYSDLAIKTGMPLKQLSDQTLKPLMKENGAFIDFIKKKYGNVTKYHLTSFDGVYVYIYGTTQITQNIRNDGKFPVKGGDYDVVFHFRDDDGVCASNTKTMDGVDLAPGETFTFTFEINGFAPAAYYKTLRWTVSFNQKGDNSLKEILKIAKFTGTEYDEFVNQAKREKTSKTKQ